MRKDLVLGKGAPLSPFLCDVWNLGWPDQMHVWVQSEWNGGNAIGVWLNYSSIGHLGEL